MNAPRALATPESLVRNLVLDLAGNRHVDLPEVCEQLGLPAPPPRKRAADSESPDMTKAERMEAVFAQIRSADYLSILQRFLEQGLRPEQRNLAEDLIWELQSWPVIDTRTRRETAQALEEAAPFWTDPDGLLGLIKRRWIDLDPVAAWIGRGLVDEVTQHIIRNDDWTALDFFKHVGALDCPDRRFALFVQELLSGAVNPDEGRLRLLAAATDGALQGAMLRLVEVDPVDGYPAFVITRAGTRTRPARLLLFASRVIKPDIRLVDVLDTEIEVLTSNDQLLNYDRPVGAEGLCWQHLQDWWAERTDSSSETEAKNALWSRLVAAIPAVSPPQRAFFECYYRVYGQQELFLALLPEVWLHWDPQTVSRRGDEAFRTHRMDFLMLLPGHRRVVLEVDGQQHFAVDERPSPSAYARTMHGDRDLRLSGYEVYRFGAAELSSMQAEKTVREFFDRLLHD